VRNEKHGIKLQAISVLYLFPLAPAQLIAMYRGERFEKRGYFLIIFQPPVEMPQPPVWDPTGLSLPE